jgi:DNA-binding transcriptional ArsR family regulator
VSRSGAVATLWALSDETRIEILDRVASGSAVTVSQLADVLPITRQAVTRHVRTLEDAGLVVGAKRGREHLYRVDSTPIEVASRFLEARARSWDDALGRLASHIESMD